MRSRLLLIFLAIVLLATGATAAYIRSGRLHAQAAGLLVAAAQRELGREVRIGALEGDPIRGIILRQVSISAGERLADGVLLSAEVVNVRLRPGTLLRDLVRRRGIGQAVAHITLTRPDLNLEIAPDGRWNLPAFGQPAPGGRPPTPTLTVEEGRVTLTDRSRPPWPFRARIVGVNGEADLARMPVVHLRLAGTSLHDDRRTPLDIAGRYIVEGRILDLDLNARGAPLAQWGGYLMPAEVLRVEGGAADVDLRLLLSSWGSRRVLDYHGTLRIANGAATVVARQARLRSVQGTLQVSNLRVASEDLRLSVDGMPVRMRGEVTLTTPPVVDLAVTSAQADLASVQRLFFPGFTAATLRGRGGTDLRVTGPLSHPTLQGTVNGVRGTVNEQPVAAVSSGLQLIGGLLVLDGLTATAGTARAEGEVRFTIGGPEILVALTGSDLTADHLRRAGWSLRLPVRGSVNGTLLLLRDDAGYAAEVAAAMGPGRAGPLRVDAVRAAGWYERGEFAFPSLVARRGSTTVRGSGTVSPRGDLTLDAAGRDLDLRDVAREIGVAPELAGVVDAEGRITGTLSRPVFDGRVTLGPGRLEFLTFDSAEGTIRLTREGVATAGTRFRAGAGSYQVSGRVRWLRPATSLDLRVDARDIAVEPLVRSAEFPVEMTGVVSGQLTLAGTTAQPRASGTLRLRDGAIQGQRVEAARAAFRWREGILYLDEAEARVQDSRVVVRGSIDRRGPLRLTFAARGFDLRHLTTLPPALLASGEVDLSGQIGGTVARPTAVATLTADGLALNGASFDRAEGTARWRDQLLVLDPLTLQQGEGRYTLAGTLSFAGPALTLDLRGEVTRGRLATLLAVGGQTLPFALDGAVNGSLTLRGPVSRPGIAVDAALTAGRLGDQPIESAEAKISYQDDELTVERLVARVGGGTLAAQGRVARRGDSHLEVSGSSLSLDLLRPLLRLDRPLAGQVSFTTQFSGPWDDPEVGLSVEVRNGAVSGLRFDSLVANAFYRDGVVHVEQALLSENGNRAKGVGTIPFSPARRTVGELSPMRFDISLVEADLSLLALLLPQVEDAKGRIEGQVTLSGTPRHPEMTGRLAARGGRIKLRSLAGWLEDVTTEIRFNADRLNITTLTARLGEGTVDATGVIAVTNFRPSAIERLTLRARNARLEYPPFFSGQVDLDLAVSGALLDPEDLPEVAGQVRLKNGDLVVRAAPGRGTSPGPDLRLEGVRITSGPNLAVHLGRLRVEVRAGSVVVARGTLRRPELDGELVADRGTVVVFGRTFSVREGQARFLPQLGLRPIISLDAEAQVGDTRIFLEIRQALPEELADRLILRSDPPFSREEILQLLGQQLVAQGQPLPSGVDIQQLLGAELSRVLFGDVEEAIARSLGLSEFTIQYDFVNPLQLRVGTLLVRNLYLTLTTEFGPTTRFVWALEWRFAPNLMLTFTVDNLGRSDVLARYTLRF